MIAFHGKQEIKDKYLARVRAHRAADEIVRGQYWAKSDDGIFRGCAVGCTLHSSDHAAYETELGIPRILARLEDGIFEALPEDRAMAWPEEFLAAPAVGADLSLVWPQFAVWLMIDAEYGVMRHAKSDAAKAAIQAVADAYGRVMRGEVVTATEWRKIYKNAAYAYAYAADAAAYAAYAYAYAADAAAYAAYAADAADAAADAADAAADAAARKKTRVAQAEKLLELLASAPVAVVEALA